MTSIIPIYALQSNPFSKQEGVIPGISHPHLSGHLVARYIVSLSQKLENKVESNFMFSHIVFINFLGQSHDYAESNLLPHNHSTGLVRRSERFLSGN